jgi:ATP-binding cassette subfamily B protein
VTAGDANVTWPASRLGEALDALTQRSGLSSKAEETRNPGASIVRDPVVLSRWVETAAASLQLEAEPANVQYSELEDYLSTAGPAVIRCSRNGEVQFLVVLETHSRKVRVLGPDFAVHNFAAARLKAQLCQEIEGPLAGEIEGILDQAGIPPRRRARTGNAILADRLARRKVADGWSLRLPPGASFWRQFREMKLPPRLIVLAVAHLAEYLLWIGAWWMIGQAALAGRLDRGWLAAWALMLVTLAPVRMLQTWLQGRIAIAGGGLLKVRLLAGALRLEPDEIRHRGAGQFLGQVIEAEAVESLALSGGFLALVAAIELILAGAVLAIGAGGPIHALLLAAWVLAAVWLGWRYFRSARRWTSDRLDMTHRLVERMVGHRTRLAQQPAGHWHDGEDQELDRYLSLSREMDRNEAWFLAFVPRGWLLVGVAGIGPAFVNGSGSTAALAIALGGTLLAFGALQRLTAGLWNLVGARIAWEQVAPLFHAAGRPQDPGHPATAAAGSSDTAKLIEAYDLVFRYQERAEPVLRHCNLSVSKGDRILLEGPSGGGKSTLASMLTGLRSPESGLLLVGGLDRQTLGPIGWQRRVAAAPQFHENHVLTGTFGFNALMARDGILTWNDFQEAEEVCNELGLGDLIRRMPAGMLQMVGDTGWQLSHGERSRLFIARALLQGAELIVLDESFAALDPENLRCALECVLRRARSVMVIAHR